MVALDASNTGGSSRAPATADTTTGNTTTTTSSSSGGGVVLPYVLPPERDVARPVSNLGNTCYMNVVLQALAHAPELCLAMDCNPHHLTCPTAMENRRRRRRRLAAASPETASSSSPSDLQQEQENNIDRDDLFDNNITLNTTLLPPTGVLENEIRRTEPGRKVLRRSSRKSPTNGMSANTTITATNNNELTADGGGSPTNKSNGGSAQDDDNLYCALCEMEWHLQEVHSLSSSRDVKDSTAVAPSFFVHGFLNNVASHFKLGQQEDSHEFLRLLIEAMQRSCKKARTASIDDLDIASRGMEIDGMNVDKETLAAAAVVDDDGNDENARNTKNVGTTKSQKDIEYPFELFTGTVESCVTCKSCKASSSTLDPIEDVGLEVTVPTSSTSSSLRTTPPPNEPLADVASAFKRFACVEDLDSYKCDKCGKSGSATKQSRLASIPPILTLHLKRFRYGADGRGTAQVPAVASNRRGMKQSGSAKIEGHIKFDQIFNLKPFLTAELQAKQKSSFCRLFALIVHNGKNSHSGHYIAYVRNIQKNEWWKMDDARVTQVTIEEVMQAEAYMLFYRVVEHPTAVSLKQRAKELQDEREAMIARMAAEENEAAAVAAAATTEGKVGDKENTPENDEATADSPDKPTNSNKTGTAKSSGGGRNSNKRDGGASGGGGAGTSTASSSCRKRERNLPDFFDGKSWARAKTNLKAPQISKLRSAEEYVNEQVQFTPEFFKIITEEGAKDSARVDQCPIKRVSGEDIVNDNDQLKLGLKKVIHRMALRYESENGESFFRAPAAAAAAAAAAGKTTTAAVRDQSSSIVAPDEIVTS